MIDRNHALPIARQAELVGISRGNVYYLARAACEADQRLMKRIDMLSLAHPFAGSRMLRDVLNREGFDIRRRHVATLMRRMGIEEDSHCYWTRSERVSNDVQAPVQKDRFDLRRIFFEELGSVHSCGSHRAIGPGQCASPGSMPSSCSCLAAVRVDHGTDRS